MQAPGSRIPPIRAAAVTGDLYQPCACLQVGMIGDFLEISICWARKTRLTYCATKQNIFWAVSRRLKNDHPGYPCGKAHWAFVTGVGPFAEIGVGLGEPYRADKQHPTEKAQGGSRNLAGPGKPSTPRWPYFATTSRSFCRSRQNDPFGADRA